GPKTRAALHYARTLTLDDGRDTEVYEELKKYYSNAEVIELAAFFCLTAGGNRMAKSWSIEPHGEVSAIPDGALSIHGSEKEESERARARTAVFSFVLRASQLRAVRCQPQPDCLRTVARRAACEGLKLPRA